jgi:putative peptide zinc metalloprotease protein
VKSLFSPHWYRVAPLKPRLRAHVEWHRHRYRGQPWWVLLDRSSGRVHRMSPAAWSLCGLMDGERSVQEIWEAATTRLGDEAPTQDETIQVLARLHAADVLQCDVPPDGVDLFQRLEKAQRARWKRRLSSPLSLRVPLFDPDRWLGRALPAVRPLFGPAGLAVWLLVVGSAALLAAVHGAEIARDAAAFAFASHNLLVLSLVYPLVKALHEAGHAFATKVWGGEVHEAGLMLLVLMPVPYVDASASAAFRERRRRVAVGAAGIAVELFLAALALFVWLAVEPGAVRLVALDVMLIGGVSTLLFNGNPLLRFDGYYVLSDWIDVPNLGPRGTRQVAFLAQRHLLGLDDAESPVTAPGEAPWLVAHALLSFAYRSVVLCGIALFVAERFFFVGVGLALWVVGSQVLVPAARGAAFLWSSPRVERRRGRARLVGVLGLAAAGLLLFVVPLPLRTRAEGVIWPPEHSQVRARTDGFVRRVLAVPGARVALGDPLFESEDPFLGANVKLLEGRLRELRARWEAAERADRVQAELAREEMATVEADLARARERAAEAVVRSPADGSFVVSDPDALIDRFVKQGELLGWVTDLSEPSARVVVTQAEVALVRGRTRDVTVRLVERPGETLAARIEREVPSGSNRLPSPTLGSQGGGPFAVDPADEEGTSALERVFQFELALPPDAAVAHVGGRVHVRFHHGVEPVALRWGRDLRRLFLRRFGV